jgi:hypothetical protein
MHPPVIETPFDATITALTLGPSEPYGTDVGRWDYMPR